jgi:hypothetical protein
VYQFRDLIEINSKRAKLTEIFNCLGVQLPNFQQFRDQNKNVHLLLETSSLLVKSIAAETSPLRVEQSCSSSPSRFNRLENLQRIQSNRGPRLSPTISFVEDNSPAKAGLMRGNRLGL